MITAVRKWIWPTAKEKMIKDVGAALGMVNRHGRPELGSALAELLVQLRKPTPVKEVALKDEMVAGALSKVVKAVLLAEAKAQPPAANG